eukprot:320434-Pleurochrysis_carterae.AAC.1
MSARATGNAKYRCPQPFCGSCCLLCIYSEMEPQVSDSMIRTDVMACVKNAANGGGEVHAAHAG